MSRTYRNKEPFNVDWLKVDIALGTLWKNELELHIKRLNKYYTDNQNHCNAPKWFRKLINQKYRNNCNHQISSYIKNDLEDIDLVLEPFKKNANYHWW